MADLAGELDAKYAPQGIRIVLCGDVYAKAAEDFGKWLVANGYPNGEHADIKDTSEMLYHGRDKGWVRKDRIATAVEVPGSRRGAGVVGDHGPVPEGGSAPAAQSGQPRATVFRVMRGVPPRKLGEDSSICEWSYAVNQIRQLLAATPTPDKP